MRTNYYVSSMCDGRLFLIFLLKKRLSSLPGLNITFFLKEEECDEEERINDFGGWCIVGF